MKNKLYKFLEDISVIFIFYVIISSLGLLIITFFAFLFNSDLELTADSLMKSKYLVPYFIVSFLITINAYKDLTK